MSLSHCFSTFLVSLLFHQGLTALSLTDTTLVISIGKVPYGQWTAASERGPRLFTRSAIHTRVRRTKRRLKPTSKKYFDDLVEVTIIQLVEIHLR